MNQKLTNPFQKVPGRRLVPAASLMLFLLLFVPATFARAANIERIGQIPNGICTRLVIKDHYVVLAWQNQLTVLDIDNPNAPRQVSQLTLPNQSAVKGMALNGDRLYIVKPYGRGWSKLETVDLTHPETPSLTGNTWVWGFNPTNLVMNGNLAFIVDSGAGLRLADLSTPTTATTQTGQFPATDIYDVATTGSLACLATQSGLRVVDVSDPTSPTQVGSLPGQWFYYVQIAGNRAYAASLNGLAIISLADPAHPVQLNATMPQADFFTIKGTLLYSGNWGGKVQIFDIADPANPTPRGSLSIGDRPTVTIAQQDGILYMSGDATGLNLVNVRDPDHPIPAGYLPGRCMDAAYDRQWLYLAQNNGVLTVDLTDPTSPVQRALYRMPNTIASLARDGQNLYALTAIGMGYQLMILDATDPTSLTLKGRGPISFPGDDPFPVQTSNGLVLTPDDNNQVILIDAHDPTAPQVMSHIGSNGNFGSIEINGPHITAAAFGPPNTLYALTQRSGTWDALSVFDISNPVSPRIVNSFPVVKAVGLEYRNGTLYVTTDACQTLIFDVREPYYPRLQDLFPHGDNSYLFVNSIHQFGDRRVGLRDRYNPYTTWTYPRESLDLYDLTDFTQPRLLGRWPNFTTGGYSINVNGDQALLLNHTDLSLYRLRADAAPLVILAPARKTQVTGGDPLPVHWQIDKQAAGTTVRFELVDASGKATLLGEGVAESGETTTTLRVPVLPAGSYHLRATSTAQPDIQAESLLYIDVTGTGVGLFEPAGGETFQSGQTITARWEGHPTLTGEKVRFELWRGWTKVGDIGTAAVTTCEIRTQLTLPANLAPATNYFLLVVSQSNEAVFARNPASFTIAQ